MARWLDRLMGGGEVGKERTETTHLQPPWFSYWSTGSLGATRNKEGENRLGKTGTLY